MVVGNSPIRPMRPCRRKGRSRPPARMGGLGVGHATRTEHPNLGGWDGSREAGAVSQSIVRSKCDLHGLSPGAVLNLSRSIWGPQGENKLNPALPALARGFPVQAGDSRTSTAANRALDPGEAGVNSASDGLLSKAVLLHSLASTEYGFRGETSRRSTVRWCNTQSAVDSSPARWCNMPWRCHGGVT